MVTFVKKLHKPKPKPLPKHIAEAKKKLEASSPLYTVHVQPDGDLTVSQLHNQVAGKSEAKWTTMPQVPTGGQIGQILMMGPNGPEWAYPTAPVWKPVTKAQLDELTAYVAASIQMSHLLTGNMYKNMYGDAKPLPPIENGYSQSDQFNWFKVVL